MSEKDRVVKETGEGKSYPKGRYIERTAEEYQLIAWAVDEKIIKRFDQRSAIGLGLMVESRNAAENQRRKKKRAGRPAAGKVQTRLTAEELKDKYLLGRSSVDDVRDSLRRNKNAGLIAKCSPTAATFAKTFDDLDHQYLQARFPNYEEKCTRFHARLAVINRKRRRVNVRIPRKWEKEMAGGLKWSVGGLGIFICIQCLYVDKQTNQINPVGWINLDKAATFVGLSLDALRDALETLEDYDFITVLRRCKDQDTRRPVCYQIAVNLDWDGISVAPVAEEPAGASEQLSPDKFPGATAPIPDKFPNRSIYNKHPLSNENTNHNHSLHAEKKWTLSHRKKANHSLASEQNGHGVFCKKGGKRENLNTRFLFRIQDRKELRSIPKLKTFFAVAQEKGWFGEGQAEWELFVASAIRAYTRGTKNRNTGGFFYTIVSHRECRAYLSDEHRHKARALIKGRTRSKAMRPERVVVSVLKPQLEPVDQATAEKDKAEAYAKARESLAKKPESRARREFLAMLDRTEKIPGVEDRLQQGSGL